jgi:hypothetical protein
VKSGGEEAGDEAGGVGDRELHFDFDAAHTI